MLARHTPQAQAQANAHENKFESNVDIIYSLKTVQTLKSILSVQNIPYFSFGSITGMSPRSSDGLEFYPLTKSKGIRIGADPSQCCIVLRHINADPVHFILFNESIHVFEQRFKKVSDTADTDTDTADKGLGTKRNKRSLGPEKSQNVTQHVTQNLVQNNATDKWRNQWFIQVCGPTGLYINKTYHPCKLDTIHRPSPKDYVPVWNGDAIRVGEWIGTLNFNE